MPLVHVGGGTFVDTSPLGEEEVRGAGGRMWSPRTERLKVYAYVSFRSLERASYGLFATEGAHDEPEVASVKVDEATFEPGAIAALTEFSEAMEILKEGEKGAFGDFPFVEVESREDYVKAAARMEGASFREWDPRVLDAVESRWEGPGVYDFRDRPPTLHLKSVEEYEVDGMAYWADDLIESMFQGDEWKASLREMLVEAAR